MKQFIKVVLSALCCVIVLAVCYSAYVVIKAKRDTPAMLQRALDSGQMTLTVKDLSDWQKQALLAVEDPSFYAHRGVDLRTPGAGLTTITQGLVKILYFDKFKPGFLKLKQTLIALFVLDKALSKDDQLTLFINSIYLGSVYGKPVYGFDNAARTYYGKTVQELSEDEYLSIVTMIVSPKGFNIIDRPQANRERLMRIKKVVAGEYKPVRLMDIYYGELDAETQKWLAPASYFPSIYKKKQVNNN